MMINVGNLHVATWFVVFLCGGGLSVYPSTRRNFELEIQDSDVLFPAQIERPDLKVFIG